MINKKKILSIIFMGLFITYSSKSQEHPSITFNKLYEKYSNTESKDTIISNLGEDVSITIYDINKEISKDVFCIASFSGSSGQNQYLVYRRDDILWWIQKKTYIYREGESFNLETAEIRSYYFMHIFDLTLAFNEETGRFDTVADINKYSTPVADVRTLEELIEILQNVISMYR